MAPTCTISNKRKKKKKEKKEGSFFVESWQWNPPTPISNKTKLKKRKKMGAWAPLLLRVDDGAHLHPQVTKHKEKN
jgi:hypothetical protein